MSETIRTSMRELHQKHSDLNADELAERLEQQTGIRLSRRTIYRVLADMEGRKKTAQEEKPVGDERAFLES